MASTDPNIDLINNGIQTIEFIQSHRDEVQKTYGRSAISKPGTKERTAAWETYLENQDNDAGGQRRRGEGEESSHESGGQDGNGHHGQDKRAGLLSESETRNSSGSGDNERGDDKNSSQLNVGAGEGGGREGNGTGGGRSSERKGADGTEGGDSIGTIDDNDYDRIRLLDQATEDHLAGREPPGHLEIREAQPSDIAEILGEDTSRTHRRLRGIKSMSRQSASLDEEASPVKKGHRREFCIDVFEGKTYVRQWCNPSCTPISVNPYQQECQCRQCPKTCPDCKRD
nr:V protein [Meliandou uranomys virus]